jgi:hypothetical protein
LTGRTKAGVEDNNMAQCEYSGANRNAPGGAVFASLAGFGAEQSIAIFLANNSVLPSQILLGTVFSDGDGIATFIGHLPNAGLTSDENYFIEGADQENTSADSATFAINVPAATHPPQGRLSIGLGIGL